MGLVWELDLPQNLKFLLLAMADHADHHGGNVRPSVGLLAWKVGSNRRTVQRHLRQLEGLSLIEVEKPGGGILAGVGDGRTGRATVYRLTLGNGVKAPPFRADEVIPSESTTAAPDAGNSGTSRAEGRS